MAAQIYTVGFVVFSQVRNANRVRVRVRVKISGSLLSTCKMTSTLLTTMSSSPVSWWMDKRSTGTTHYRLKALRTSHKHAQIQPNQDLRFDATVPIQYFKFTVRVLQMRSAFSYRAAIFFTQSLIFYCSMSVSKPARRGPFPTM